MKLGRVMWMGMLALCLTPVVVAEPLQAVSGEVSGAVQKVGFRAFVFREAIRYNLGGVIENLPDGRVHFVLQGEGARLDAALAALRRGPPKSRVSALCVEPVPVDEGINQVLVKGWTSQTRAFNTPVDLVYPLREDAGVLDAQDAARIYQHIIASAMAGARTAD